MSKNTELESGEGTQIKLARDNFCDKQATVYKPLTCLPINSQIDFDISKGRLHETQCSLKDSNFKYHSHMNLRGHI